MFYIRLFEDDERKYGFERFSYLKSYNENSKVTIEGFYKLSGPSSGESGSGSAGTLAMNKADGSLSPSVVGLEKGKKVSVELIYHFAQIGIKDHAKKSVAVNEEQNSVLLKFTGIVQSVSSKSQISGKRMHSVALTSDFANMSGTTNEIFHPKNGENKDGGAEGGGKQDNTFSLSEVVNGPMSKYMADSENGGSEVTLASDFADASTSSGIFSLSDSKNLAYDISKDYGFSIYDTQRKEGDKWKTDSVVEIKRIGRGEKSETISLSDQNEGDSSLVVNAVRQIARNNVVYDGIATLNPIAYYKDMATVDDAKTWGKQMSVINQAQEGGNPIDSNGGNALPTMADPFGFCEDGADADKKIAGRKDYKIFERSEYEMDLSSVPAVVVRNKTDEEDKVIKTKITRLKKTIEKGYHPDPKNLSAIGVRNVGCSSCPMKMNETCNVFMDKHKRGGDELSHNEYKALQPFVGYKVEDIKRYPAGCSFVEYAYYMNRFLSEMLWSINKHCDKNCPSSHNDDDLDKELPYVSDIFVHGTCATVGWSCKDYCRNSPYYHYNYDSTKTKNGCRIVNSFYSPYGEAPTAAFCNHMNLEYEGCNSDTACGRGEKGTSAVKAYNVYMIRGKNEATHYAYLVDSQKVNTVTLAYRFKGKWNFKPLSGESDLHTFLRGGEGAAWLKDRWKFVESGGQDGYDKSIDNLDADIKKKNAEYKALDARIKSFNIKKASKADFDQQKKNRERLNKIGSDINSLEKKKAGYGRVEITNKYTGEKEYSYSSPGYMIIKPDILSLVDPITLDTVNLLDSAYEEDSGNIPVTAWKQGKINERKNVPTDTYDYWRNRYCELNSIRDKDRLSRDEHRDKVEKYIKEHLGTGTVPYSLQQVRSWLSNSKYGLKKEKQEKALCEYSEEYRYDGGMGALQYPYDSDNNTDKKVFDVNVRRETNPGNLFPLKNWGFPIRYLFKWDMREYRYSDDSVTRWWKYASNSFEGTSIASTDENAVSFGDYGLFNYEGNEQKGFKGHPFPGFVNKFFQENKGSIGTQYSDLDLKRHSISDFGTGVLFVWEPINPVVYDLMVASRMTSNYKGDVIKKKKEIEEEIKKLEGEKGATVSKSYLKVHTFFDKFPLDYVSFKGNAPGAVPINDHDYIVKEIETTISTADADIKSNLELMANPYLKAKGLAVSDMPKNPNGTTPVAVWGAKDEEAVKNDEKHMLYSDFSGVSIRLRAVPASPADKGEFVEPGKGMGIGEYAAGPESGAGAKKP